MRTRTSIDFVGINQAALAALPALLRRWLPRGRPQGDEWVACNPRRNDRTRGSFKINMRTGRWADFATGDRGGDVISLAAYLFDLSQTQAAGCVARMIGIDPEEARHG
jgi:DNA primase (bacterial type)